MNTRISLTIITCATMLLGGLPLTSQSNSIQLTSGANSTVLVPGTGTNTITLPSGSGTLLVNDGSGVSGAWLLGGNNLTTGTSSIGTTTAHDLLIIANNATRLQVLQSAHAVVLPNAAELRLAEPVGSGTNYSALKAGAQAADITYTLPLSGPAAGQYLQSDGSGNLSWATVVTGLTYFTEAQSTVAPNTPRNASSLTATGVATDIDAVLSPKGEGALQAQVADNAVAGGNKRGTYATDWQRNRSTTTQVASGAFSVIGGGYQNSASGELSTVGGGSDNTASEISSTVGGGRDNTASGEHSTVGGGDENTASSSLSTVGGGQVNTASGYASTVGGGEGNTASADWATVGGGYQNSASGNRSTAFGYYNTAQSYGETVIGLFATVGAGSAGSYVAGDRLFVVGNGTADLSRSNALTVLKNGNTTVAGNVIINGTLLDAGHDDGLIIGGAGDKLGFFNTTPVEKAAAIADEPDIAGGDPPTQAEFNALLAKFNDLLTAMRAYGLLTPSP